jgi:hypothetical protein
MISFKEAIELDENLQGISKALSKLATKPEYKKISKNLLSLSKRAAEGGKKSAVQLSTQLPKLAPKVDKKAGASLVKMGKLAATYTR